MTTTTRETSLAKLDAYATTLYNDQASEAVWLDTFTPLQLVKIWHTFCVYHTDVNGKLIESASYDDEVYNVLNTLGYWDMV